MERTGDGDGATGTPPHEWGWREPIEPCTDTMAKVRLECGGERAHRQERGASGVATSQKSRDDVDDEGTVTMRCCCCWATSRRGVGLLGWSLVARLVGDDALCLGWWGAYLTGSFAGSPVVERSCDSALATSPARLRLFHVSSARELCQGPFQRSSQVETAK